MRRHIAEGRSLLESHEHGDQKLGGCGGAQVAQRRSSMNSYVPCVCIQADWYHPCNTNTNQRTIGQSPGVTVQHPTDQSRQQGPGSLFPTVHSRPHLTRSPPGRHSRRFLPLKLRIPLFPSRSPPSTSGVPMLIPIPQCLMQRHSVPFVFPFSRLIRRVILCSQLSSNPDLKRYLTFPFHYRLSLGLNVQINITQQGAEL